MRQIDILNLLAVATSVVAQIAEETTVAKYIAPQISPEEEDCVGNGGVWCKQAWNSHEGCIGGSLLCNGQYDCLDESDEYPDNEQCPNECVQRGGVWCQRSGDEKVEGCILGQFVCDGRYDCEDKSDEYPKNKQCGEELCESLWCQSGGDAPMCMNDHDMRYICDGVKNCDDGRDEQQCTEEKCEDELNGIWCESVYTSIHHGDDGKEVACYHHAALCDGYNHCRDGSDESHDTCRQEQH